jgi:hypothetical protein
MISSKRNRYTHGKGNASMVSQWRISLRLRVFFLMGAVLLHFVIEPSMVIAEFLAQFIDDCLDLAKCCISILEYTALLLNAA